MVIILIRNLNSDVCEIKLTSNFHITNQYSHVLSFPEKS